MELAESLPLWEQSIVLAVDQCMYVITRNTAKCMIQDFGGSCDG